jgi:hypothetical protein
MKVVGRGARVPATKGKRVLPIQGEQRSRPGYPSQAFFRSHGRFCPLIELL